MIDFITVVAVIAKVMLIAIIIAGEIAAFGVIGVGMFAGIGGRRRDWLGGRLTAAINWLARPAAADLVLGVERNLKAVDARPASLACRTMISPTCIGDFRPATNRRARRESIGR